MSYIDSFNHEYIGSLGYLPIYHPLEDIRGDGWGEEDFSATPQNLILGGGSGEHPALVVHKLDCLVARFIKDQLREKHLEKLSDEDKSYFLCLCDQDKVFEFCAWSHDNHKCFEEMANSTAFIGPIAESEDIEQWLSKSLGELVYFSLAELNPEHEKLEALFSRFDIQPTMLNVTCQPPGYPQQGGCLMKDGEIIWGNHRWS